MIPRTPRRAFIREALAAALKPESRYPTSAGLPELRQAIAGWFGRRFGVTLDPDVHILPANGSKEALFNLSLALLDDPRRGPQAVGVPELAYQVYADSARLHHAEVIPLPLDADWLPDLNALTPDVLGRLRLLWLNYPNNPYGRRSTTVLLPRGAGAGRALGLLCGLRRGLQRTVVRQSTRRACCKPGWSGLSSSTRSPSAAT